MKVGICFTKNTKDGTALTKAFAAGVVATGDKAVYIKTAKDVKSLVECDVSFQVCQETPGIKSPEDTLRHKIQKHQTKHNKRRIIADTNLIPTAEKYWSIGYDGVKGAAEFYNENSSSDRQHLRNIKLKEWHQPGESITIFCQTFDGVGLRHIGRDKAKQYYCELPSRIRKYTNDQIIFRLHPNQAHEGNGWSRVDEDRIKKTVDNIVFKKGSRFHACSQSMVNSLVESRCTITRTSAACIQGLIYGIPSISEDDLNIANPVCERHLHSINTPRTPVRDQWLADLCYAEWSIEECKTGAPWQHLRTHVNKPIYELT